MLVGSLLFYVAALSVAIERVTELLKRIQLISSVLSAPQKDENMENLRVIAVHLVAIIWGEQGRVAQVAHLLWSATIDWLEPSAYSAWERFILAAYGLAQGRASH